MGPFTVNLWERANATDQDGDLFEYIYSHSAYASRDNFADVDAFHPNQVRSQLTAGTSPYLPTCLVPWRNWPGQAIELGCHFIMAMSIAPGLAGTGSPSPDQQADHNRLWCKAVEDACVGSFRLGVSNVRT